MQCEGSRQYSGAAVTPACVCTAPLAAPVVPAVAAPEPAPVRLRIHGSNTIGAELGPALVERFLAQRGASDVKRIPGASHEELRIEATLPGSDGRLQAVWAGVRGADHPFALSALPKAKPQDAAEPAPRKRRSSKKPAEGNDAT